MTRKEALERLLAKVDAGELSLNLAATAFPPESAYGRCSCHEAENAFNGSLDAAKALHEALLPGLDWAVGLDKAEYRCLLIKTPDDGSVPDVEATSASASRAWLIAILKALIAQEAE